VANTSGLEQEQLVLQELQEMTDRCQQHEKTIIGLEKFQKVSQNLKNQVANLEDTVAQLTGELEVIRVLFSQVAFPAIEILILFVLKIA
jgi:predicted Zn-dependent peptidase